MISTQRSTASSASFFISYMSPQKRISFKSSTPACLQYAAKVASPAWESISEFLSQQNRPASTQALGGPLTTRDAVDATRVHLDNDAGDIFFDFSSGWFLLDLFEAATAPTASQRDVSTLSTRGRVDAIDAASRRRRRCDHVNSKFSFFRSSSFWAPFRATV